MKRIRLRPVLGIVASGILALASACSSGDNIQYGNGTTKPSRVASHRSQDCPLINGEFVSRQKGELLHKTIVTERIQGGLHLNDSEVQWVVDGSIYPVKNNERFTYRASCSKGFIVINVFEGSKAASDLIYSLNESGHVVIEINSMDPHWGESSKEVWVPKK